MNEELLDPLLTQIISSDKLSTEAKKSILEKSGIANSHHLNSLNNEGYTLLGEMCRHMQRETIIEWLINQGANIELGNPYRGQTPLAIAAAHNNTPAMQVLLEYNANPKGRLTPQENKNTDNTQGLLHFGKPPIYSAIRYGKVEAVELLLAYEAIETEDNGKYPKPVDDDSQFHPLHYARSLLKEIENNEPSTEKLLLIGNLKDQNKSFLPTRNDLLRIIMVLKCAEQYGNNLSKSAKM